MDDVKPRISVEYVDEVMIASLVDERIVDPVQIQALEDSIMPLAEQAKKITLILDFSNVKFLSSVMLGVLIRISKRVYETNGRLALCGINPNIHQVFKITRLDKIFDIYENADKAVRQFAAKD